MNKWKSFCLLVVLFLFCLPQITFGQETMDAEVGIGFTSNTNQPAANEPIENVLPMTNARSATYYQGTQAKRLPQTGDHATFILRFWGILCLILVFWLFLFRQLREEEENE